MRVLEEVTMRLMKRVVLILLIVVGSLQAGRVMDGRKEYNKDFPMAHESIQFNGVWYDCLPLTHNVSTTSSSFCTCPFLACSGGEDCTYCSLHCFIINTDYDYLDMKDTDCGCHWH